MLLRSHERVISPHKMEVLRLINSLRVASYTRAYSFFLFFLFLIPSVSRGRGGMGKRWQNGVWQEPVLLCVTWTACSACHGALGWKTHTRGDWFGLSLGSVGALARPCLAKRTTKRPAKQVGRWPIGQKILSKLGKPHAGFRTKGAHC